LPQAFVNFLCLLGWSPKDNREQMTLQELIDAFSFDGVNRSNAVVNFKEDDPIDPKALWLNGEHIRSLPAEELALRLAPFVCAAGFHVDPGKMTRIAKLVQERIRLLRDVLTVGDFFFASELAPYDSSELIPEKGDRAMAFSVLRRARETLEAIPFDHQSLETALRAAAKELRIKTGQMFLPVRVAVCGRKTAPPLFETLEVLGRETCLRRIGEAIRKLE
jgi:glutamyl-tRNA synthetase